MINPETDDIAAALRVLALADTFGHMPLEETHAQTAALLIEVEPVYDGAIKTSSLLVLHTLQLMTGNGSTLMAECAGVLRAQVVALRDEIMLARVSEVAA